MPQLWLRQWHALQFHPSVHVGRPADAVYPEAEFWRQAATPEQPLHRQRLAQAGGCNRAAPAGDGSQLRQPLGRGQIPG